MKSVRAIAIAITLCLSVITSVATAQSHVVSLAVKGGYGFSEITLEDGYPTYGDYGGKGAAAGGITIGMTFSPNVSLDTDIMYVQRLSHWEFETQRYVESIGLEVDGFIRETRLWYITVAPMLRFAVGHSRTRPYFKVGPEVGYLTGATFYSKSWSREGSWSSESEATLDVKYQYKDTNVALNAGAGMEVRSRGVTFFAEAIYSHGLTSINAVQKGDYGPTEKTRTASVLAGVRF